MATYDPATPAPPYGYPAAGGNRVDAQELLKVVRRRRRLILGVVLGISSVATVVAFGLTPRYVGVASVTMDPQATRVVNTEAVLEEQAQDRFAIETEITRLRSRSFAKRLLEQSELLADPEFDAQPERPSPLQALVAEHWPGVSQWLSRSWLVETGLAKSSMPQPEETSGGNGPDVDAAVDGLLKNLNVSRTGESYAISIQFTSTDPVKAAQLANEIARYYVDDLLAEKQAAAGRASQWLSRRLGELRGELLASESAIASYRGDNQLLDDSRGVTLEAAQLAALHSELITARAERAQKETKLNLLRRLRKQGEGYESVNEIVSSPVIGSLRAQQTELLREEAQLMQEYGPRHPTIIQLNAEKQRLQDKIYSEVQNIINAFESEVGFLRNRERELEASLEQAKTRVVGSQQAAVQLRELEREAEANRALYTALLERFKKLTEQQDGLEAGAQIISTAAVPTAPAFPQPKLIIMLGFTGSCVIAGLLTLIAESLESGLRSAAQVERALGLSCLAHVPHVKLKGNDRVHQYPTRKPRSAYAEAVRSVHVSLQFTSVGQPPQVVLVTSSLPSEGKTTLALSLATSSAAAGQKSLILDLDLRHPSVRPASDQASSAPGLVELVSGDVKLEDVIYTDPSQPNLDMITVKRNPVNPIDLLASNRMPLLLTQLRSRYKFIVLDAPPILGITDTKISMHLADAVLFVVRWGKTKADVAFNGVAALRECRAPLAGVVMTQVNMRRHAQAAYGDAVEYYNQYKHYYTD